MGKSVWAEDFLQDYISSVCDAASSSTIGIIAGHKSSQRDYAVALFPTPPEDDEEEEESSPGGEIEKRRWDLGGVSDQWVSEHARQVMRMLPGGLGVIGLYATATDAELNNSQSKLRQILFAIYKLFQRKHLIHLNSNEEALDWSILQISKNTKKITCKTYNVADPKSTAKPTDWKFQSFVNNWSSVSCRFEVHLRIPFQKSFRDCSHYSKFVLSGADNILNAVQDSVVLVNGQLRDGGEQIESLQGKRKGGKKSSASSSQSMEINAELLMEKSVQSPPQDLWTTIAGDTNIIGWIQAKGYLCPRSTFSDVEKVIKEDIERSLRVRFDLLGEELRQSSGEEEVKELEIEPPSIIATPQRVFVKLPGTPISVSDYVFQDEQPQDVGAHFLELLNISVTEEDVDFNSEQMPDDTLLQQIETASSQSSDSANIEELLHKPQHSRRAMLGYAGLAFAGVGAALAAGISYLTMEDQG